MHSLRDIQRYFYDAIARGYTSHLAMHVLADDIPATARIHVYVNNLRETARKTLTASYPVTEELVGADCFRNLARVYLSRYPSTSGDIARFGAELPQFLEEFYRATPHAYLGAVAALEWACAEAAMAADAAPLAAATLRDIDEPDMPDLGFELHASVRLVESAYPVFSIWRAHQERALEGIDAARGAENVLVYRQAGNIVAQQIDDARYAFVARLGSGCSLYRAQSAATDCDASFDLAAALRDLYGAGLLVGLALPDQVKFFNGGSSDVSYKTH